MCRGCGIFTFETLVSVVLVDEDIIWGGSEVRMCSRQRSAAMLEQLTALVLARRQRRRGKSEALHLRRLGQQWPSRRLYGHIVAEGKAGVGGRWSWSKSKRWAQWEEVSGVVERAVL